LYLFVVSIWKEKPINWKDYYLYSKSFFSNSLLVLDYLLNQNAINKKKKLSLDSHPDNLGLVPSLA